MFSFLNIIGCVSPQICADNVINRYKSFEVPLADSSKFQNPGFREWVAVDSQPSILHKGELIYPCEVKRNGVTGKVVLKCLLDENGKITAYMVYESPDERLTVAAANALMEMKFRPAKRNGKGVKVWITYPFKFDLR